MRVFIYKGGPNCGLLFAAMPEKIKVFKNERLARLYAKWVRFITRRKRPIALEMVDPNPAGRWEIYYEWIVPFGDCSVVDDEKEVVGRFENRNDVVRVEEGTIEELWFEDVLKAQKKE